MHFEMFDSLVAVVVVDCWVTLFADGGQIVITRIINKLTYCGYKRCIERIL